MTALDLLVSLCETDAEDYKYCHINKNGSLERIMLEGTWIGGYTLTCGQLKEGAMYFIVDVPLEDNKPDLIYVHKSDKDGFEASLFGYQVDDILTDEEVEIA